MLEMQQPPAARQGVATRTNQSSTTSIITVWLLGGILLCSAINTGFAILNEIRVQKVMSGLRDFGEKMKEGRESPGN